MKKTAVFLLVLANAVFFLAAHGLEVQVEIKSPLVLSRSVYEGGIALAFASVVVFGPDGQEFQNGRTDRQGRFVFYADRPGQWTIVVDDEMGHRREVEVRVFETDEKQAVALDPVTGAKIPAWFRMLFGVFLILLLSALLFLWKKNRETRLH